LAAAIESTVIVFPINLSFDGHILSGEFVALHSISLQGVDLTFADKRKIRTLLCAGVASFIMWWAPHMASVTVPVTVCAT
jgi:hypothetical protein